MISQIGLTNFKCFKGEHSFPLSRFNLLTGVNGRGKSTLLQSLLLMKQTTDYYEGSNYLVLNGSCIQLGEFSDIKNSFANNTESIEFSIKLLPTTKEFHSSFIEITELTISYQISQNIEDEFTTLIKSYKVELEGNEHIISKNVTINESKTLVDGNKFYRKTNDKVGIATDSSRMFTNLIPNMDFGSDTGISDFYNLFKHIQFISADRIGPKNYYEIQNINKDFSWVGSKGENTASILLKKKDKEIHQALYLGEDTNTLLQQTEEWLNFIFDGAKIDINTEGGVVALTYNTKQGRERYKPSNVGFGYSYILPIVVAGLIAQSGEILIIENPEAHLHPRAQHKLTQFLAKVAATGVQIFVESHSEHILNALRICTIEQEGQEKILDNTDLSILYFQDNLTTPFIHIPIDEKGGIEEWPDGFFDQTDKDFKILFGF